MIKKDVRVLYVCDKKRTNIKQQSGQKYKISSFIYEIYYNRINRIYTKNGHQYQLLIQVKKYKSTLKMFRNTV